MIGGLATADLPDDFRPGYIVLAREDTGVREYLMPPLPNTLFTRDTTCWIYGVVIGMSERSSRQAITQVAAALFEHGAAERVIVAGMPKLRSAMHLDTIFTFADRDCVTTFPEIADGIHPFTLRPGDETAVEVNAEKDSFTNVVAAALNLPQLRVVNLGGEACADERPAAAAAGRCMICPLIRDPVDF